MKQMRITHTKNSSIIIHRDSVKLLKFFLVVQIITKKWKSILKYQKDLPDQLNWGGLTESLKTSGKQVY